VRRHGRADDAADGPGGGLIEVALLARVGRTRLRDRRRERDAGLCGAAKRTLLDLAVRRVEELACRRPLRAEWEDVFVCADVRAVHDQPRGATGDGAEGHVL